MQSKSKRISVERKKEIRNFCREARANILTMTTLAQSGHPGGSMSMIETLVTLYEMAFVDPLNPDWPERDIIVVSNGHISPAVYCALGFRGFFPIEDAIVGYRLAGNPFEGHIEPNVPGVELATGNLGQGLSAATGFALACRLKGIRNKVFVVMGDGEQQKGQISEARRFAVKYRLSNITAIVDYNRLQICGSIKQVMPQNILENYRSDGWYAVEINGHSVDEIEAALHEADKIDKPVLILANTVMGKGVSFMENQARYHGAPLSADDLDKALRELGLPNRLGEFRAARAVWTPPDTPYRKPVIHKPLETGTHRQYESPTDCRSSWGNALADLATINGNAPYMAVFDCDLQGSVKTDGFEKVLPRQFYQSGIQEHHTATAAGAMSKLGLNIFWADFGVFGVDEVYNQLRLNDINETNLKLITTHVGLDVGEDGKTHQCVDYLGLIRNLYGFRTLVPADPNQTDHLVRYIAHTHGNHYIPMGRSKLDIIRKPDGPVFFDGDYRFEYGKADRLRDGDRGALLVMGTLTPRAVNIADKLRESGLSIQVWNIACPHDIDIDALKAAVRTGLIMTFEDHNIHTGLGSSVANAMIDNGLSCKFHRFGPDHYGFSGTSAEVYRHFGLDEETMVANISRLLAGEVLTP